jgi:TonB family protein
VRVRVGVIWLSLLCGASALAYEGAARREAPDGGAHVPLLTRPPELLEFVQAPYPEQAQQEGLQGSVKLSITLDAEGAVAAAAVTEPAGHGFDEAALWAVKQFRFSPAEVDGHPAAVQLEYVYHFTLQAPAPDPEAPPAPPPEGTLTGQIIARGSRHRVPGATVRCGDEVEAPEALSDDEGRFRLQTQAGPCEVRVVATGYELLSSTQSIPAHGTVEVIYHLVPRAIGFETVVRGTRERTEVVRRTLDRQELQRVPGTFGDPVRVVEALPGVARAPFGLGALIIRGAAPDQTRTLFDGVEIPLLYHLGGGPSVVNPEFLDRVDFYPGGFGARYGRAVGGVIDVGTRKGASDTWHGSVDVDLLDSGFFIEAPVGKDVSVAAAARRSYVDVLLPWVLPDDPGGGTLQVLPRYWDYQLRVDLGGRALPEPGRAANSYYVMAFGSDDKLDVVATGGGRNRDVTLDVHTLFHRVKGDWTWRYGKMTSTFAPYVGYDVAGFGFGDFSLDATVWNLGAREDFRVDLSERLVLRGGLDLKFEHLRGTARGVPEVGGVMYRGFPGADPQAPVRDYLRVINGLDAAAYTELDVKFGGLTLTPGLRATGARLYGQRLGTVEPRLWARYQAGARWAFKGSAGLYSQPPALANLEPVPLGNPDLLHERAFQTSLGFEHQLTEVLRIDLTGFYNRRYDLVVSPGAVTVLDGGGVRRTPYANEGLGRAYGLELLLRHDITRNFFGWIAYTLSRTEERRQSSGRDYHLALFDQTHILTAVGSYRLPRGWELGARFRLVTGRPTTPLEHEHDQYAADANRFYGSWGAPRSTRLQPFQQLDVRVDRSFLFQDWTLNVYLDVQNVYNAQNVEATFTDYRYRTETVVPGIPILPVIGVKGSF